MNGITAGNEVKDNRDAGEGVYDIQEASEILKSLSGKLKSNIECHI